LTEVTDGVDGGEGDLREAGAEGEESNVRDGVVPHLVAPHDGRPGARVHADHHLPGVPHDLLHGFEEAGRDRGQPDEAVRESDGVEGGTGAVGEQGLPAEQQVGSVRATRRRRRRRRRRRGSARHREFATLDVDVRWWGRRSWFLFLRWQWHSTGDRISPSVSSRKMLLLLSAYCLARAAEAAGGGRPATAERAQRRRRRAACLIETQAVQEDSAY
jgi:hypothetical protein